MSYSYPSPQDYATDDYSEADQPSYPYEQQLEYTTSPISSNSWSVVGSFPTGSFPASRSTSQGSWTRVPNSSSMSPLGSSQGVNYSSSSPQQSDVYPTSTNSVQAPEVFPTDLYSLVQDAEDGSYLCLNDAYLGYSDYPRTIMLESSSTEQRHYVCLKPSCESKGKPKRVADLQRHYDTCHNENQAKYDCPKRNCNRKGSNGFSRNDHRIEHLRQYHAEDIAKRTEGGYGSRRKRSEHDQGS